MSEFLSAITAGVSAFGRFWSGSSSLFRTWNGPTTAGGEDRFQPTEKPAIDLHTQDYGAAPPDYQYQLTTSSRSVITDLCADTICGVSGYLGTTFHLHLATFLHSICAP